LWRGLVHNIMIDKPETPFERALKRYLERVGEERAPPFIDEHLRISFEGMVKYLKRLGTASSNSQ